MNLLPVPARPPARKHVLAAAVALASVGLMLVAVLGTAGLPTPFNAGSSVRVRTSPVEAEGLVETTTTVVEEDDPVVAGTSTESDTPRSVGTTRTTRPTTGTGPNTTAPPPTTTTTIPDPNDVLGGLVPRSDLVDP